MNNCSDLKEKGYKIILTLAHIKIEFFFFFFNRGLAEKRTGNSENTHSLIFQTQNLENSQETPSIGRRPETSTSSCKDVTTVFRTLGTGVCGGRDRARGRVNVSHRRWEPCGYISARGQTSAPPATARRAVRLFSHSASSSLRPCGLQHTRPPCRPLSWSQLKLMSIEL